LRIKALAPLRVLPWSSRTSPRFDPFQGRPAAYRRLRTGSHVLPAPKRRAEFS
jgi:hypothetical protein